jgi:hypothetical protein
MNKTDQIREAYTNLPIGASNRQVSAEVELKFGFTPTPQAIYATIGSEPLRSANKFTFRQVLAAQQTAKLFQNIKEFSDCVYMLRQLEAEEKREKGLIENVR